MKKLILSLFTLLLTFGLWAQSNVKTINPTAQRITERLVEQLHLNETQMKEVQRIQNRQQNQLQQIAALKNSNIETYYLKLKDVLVGNKAAVRMILNKDQLKLANSMIGTLRTQRVAKANELRAQDASQTEIERAMLDLELELVDN